MLRYKIRRGNYLRCNEELKTCLTKENRAKSLENIRTLIFHFKVLIFGLSSFGVTGYCCLFFNYCLINRLGFLLIRFLLTKLKRYRLFL